jgi:hypothetical protein
MDSGVPDSGVIDSGALDSGAAADASAGDAGTCPATGDPVACDDGTGSLGTGTRCLLARDAGAPPGATESYHLRVSGSTFATLGACLYVTPSSCPTTGGDVLEFSGGTGTSPGSTLNGLGEKTPYCFRLLSVAWDSNWADDGTTTGGPVGMGGNVLAASQRPQALIEWVHSKPSTRGVGFEHLRELTSCGVTAARRCVF